MKGSNLEILSWLQNGGLEQGKSINQKGNQETVPITQAGNKDRAVLDRCGQLQDQPVLVINWIQNIGKAS